MSGDADRLAASPVSTTTNWQDQDSLHIVAPRLRYLDEPWKLDDVVKIN